MSRLDLVDRMLLLFLIQGAFIQTNMGVYDHEKDSHSFHGHACKNEIDLIAMRQTSAKPEHGNVFKTRHCYQGYL